MRRLLALTAVFALVLLAALPAQARRTPATDFCQRKPDHPHCVVATPSPTATLPLQTETPTPSPSPTSTPTPSPTLSPSPTPTPSAGCNVSGLSIPSPRSGYTREFQLGFCGHQALGTSSPDPITAQWIRPRPDVAHDCQYHDSSGRGLYCWKNTTSEHDGVLDQWLRVGTTCDNPGPDHDPTGKCIFVNAPLINGPGGTPVYPGDRDQFSVYLIARFDDIPGRKIAYLNWAWGTNVNGEDDFPEAKLDGGSCKGSAFHHFDRAEKGQQAFSACVDLNDWHLYEIEFQKRTATRSGFVTFRLDGRVIGTTTQYVPDDPMHFVGQAETYLSGQTLPYPYPEGHIYWDAIALDSVQ